MPDEITQLLMGNVRWPEPRWIGKTLLLALILAASAGGISLLLPKTYRAEAKILPDSPSTSASSLLGLAASSSLGDLAAGQLGAVENPLLTYPEILASRALLTRVATTELKGGGRAAGVTIMSALGIRGADRMSLDKAFHALARVTQIDARLRSGIIAVNATTRDSVLSAFIVECMLKELDRFNLEMRSSRGRGARRFIEGRVEEARKELGSKEDALAAFRRTNVRIGNSPQLQLEQSRLEREVVTSSELFALLTREYEMARIEEMRDTPTFSVVEPPRPPARQYRPRIAMNVAIAFVIGVGLRVVFLFLPVLRLRSGAGRR